MLQGTPLSKDLITPITNISGIVLIVFSVFNKWIWRWKIFYPWLVKKPYIQGTWKGTIVSNWRDPATGTNPEPLQVFLVVVQEYSSVNAFLLSKDSHSELLSGEIKKKADGDFQFIYVYRNTPKVLIRETNPIHFGSVILDIGLKPKLSLEGQYWTDRGTMGQMQFCYFSKERYSTFEEAAKGEFIERLKM